MARSIADYNGGVIAPGGAYPYGDIKDAPSGTVIDRTSNADIHQFFSKMMDESGYTFNGLPDNNTNNYQLYLALLWHTNPPWQFTGVVFENDVPGNNEWDNAGSPYSKFHYRLNGDVSNGIVSLRGVVINNSVGSPATPLIMTLPVAIRPSYKMAVTAYEDLGGGGTLTPLQLYINTNGEITPESSVLSGGTLVYFDGVSYALGLDTY